VHGKRLFETKSRPKMRCWRELCYADFWTGARFLDALRRRWGLIPGKLGIGEDGLHLHQVVSHGGTRTDCIVGAKSRVNGAMLT
jgi:hypothetical protein